MLVSAVVVCIISAAATLLGIFWVGIIAALMVLAFIASLLLRQNKAANKLVLVFLIAVIFCVPLYFRMGNISAVQNLSGTSANISGYICEEPEYYDTFTIYTIKTDFVDIPNAPQNIKFRVMSFRGEGLGIHQNVKAKVTFRALDKEYKLSNYSNGIYIDASCTEIFSNGTYHHDIYSYAIALRHQISGVLERYLPYAESSVLGGIMLGDKQNISHSLYDAFKACGIVHIVNVSGLHLSIICYSLLKMLKKFKISNRVSVAITALSVLIIMAITGFTPSVMRASFMFLIMLLGRTIHRRSDGLNLLGCSVVINLFIDPMILFNVGFQLSALSTAGILAVVPYAEKRINQRIRTNNAFTMVIKYIAISIAQCVAAILFTFPVLCSSIGYVSVISPIASVLLILPGMWALIMGVLATIFGLIGITPIAYALFYPTGLLCKFFKFAVEELAKLPITVISLRNDEIFFCSVVCFIMGVFCFSRFPNHRTVKLTSVGITLIIALNLLVNTLFYSGDIRISILPLKSGHSAVVLSAQSKGSLVICPDMESEELAALHREIEANGGDIYALILPNSSADMRTETSVLFSQFNIKGIITDNKQILSADIGAALSNLSSASFELWDCVSIKYSAEENGSAFIISSRSGSVAISYPENANYTLPKDFAEADIAVIGAPYPTNIPSFLSNTDCLLMGNKYITDETRSFFGTSQRVAVLESGDKISFSLNKKPSFNN
ncbi:MAG: ComEC/Rec2 family competence protein [Clostridia bacterium]|nr:ComEC/Rec2 family competence protein [Clostridia bacterium]